MHSCSMAWMALVTALPYPDAAELTTAGAGWVCGDEATAAAETAW